ncbi:MAG TPA: NADH-quinone oxidoreductase subunit H [Candidatus Binataceae bacterium]|nr:NADH-quinone oxidoreductase subunit H [Candidatus Binataceae bacterium]
MRLSSFAPLFLALSLAPSLQGVINRVKAVVAGRVGPPLLQPYHDLLKLARKGAVYSETTTWIFRAGPAAGLAAVIAATPLMPFGAMPALIGFPADFVLLAYLLALGRFSTVLAALDTGSSFEGMGASREVTFAALAEPAFFLGIAALAKQGGHLSLSAIVRDISTGTWMRAAPALGLTAGALLVVFLAENARIPVDDPATHLELTMIHEVMVLDHCGPDLAMIEYGAALRLWLLGALIVAILVPWHAGNPWLDAGAALLGMLGIAVLTGLLESCMARLRLIHIPQLLIGAALLAALALVLVVR